MSHLGASNILMLLLLYARNQPFTQALPQDYYKAYDDYADQRLPYDYDTAYDERHSQHFSNNIVFRDCPENLFHEPVLSRAARCASLPSNIRKLLAQDAVKKTLNERSDYYSTTPLHVAAIYQNKNPYAIVKELIVLGADVHSRNDARNRTPVIAAGENVDAGIPTIKALLEDYTKYKQIKERYEYLEKNATDADKMELAQSYNFDSYNKKSLRDTGKVANNKVEVIGAAEQKFSTHYQMIKTYLTDVDDQNNTVYHVAAECRNYQLCQYLKDTYPDISVISALVGC